MSDLISRQAAIDALCNDYCGGHQDCKYYPKCENLKSIQKLPSAQPHDIARDIATIIENEKDMRVMLKNAQPDVPDTNGGDIIYRQAAIDEIDEWIKAFLENGHKESAADACLIQDGIIQLPSAQPELNEWCHDCKEYDKEHHCCPRWNRVIKTALEDAQPEIIRCKDCRWWDKYGDYDNGYCMAAKHGYWSEHWDISIRRTYKGDFFCADAEPKGEQE